MYPKKASMFIQSTNQIVTILLFNLFFSPLISLLMMIILIWLINFKHWYFFISFISYRGTISLGISPPRGGKWRNMTEYAYCPTSTNGFMWIRKNNLPTTFRNDWQKSETWYQKWFIYYYFKNHIEPLGAD